MDGEMLLILIAADDVAARSSEWPLLALHARLAIQSSDSLNFCFPFLSRLILNYGFFGPFASLGRLQMSGHRIVLPLFSRRWFVDNKVHARKSPDPKKR